MDCLQHSPEILTDFIVSKSEKLDPERFDVPLPFTILVPLTQLKMTITVDLNGELQSE